MLTHVLLILTRQVVNATPKQLAFAVQQADCDVWGCLGVVGAAACIAPKIIAVDVQGVIDCVSGNKEQVSSFSAPRGAVFILRGYSFAAALVASSLSETSSSSTTFATLKRADKPSHSRISL